MLAMLPGVSNGKLRAGGPNGWRSGGKGACACCDHFLHAHFSSTSCSLRTPILNPSVTATRGRHQLLRTARDAALLAWLFYRRAEEHQQPAALRTAAAMSTVPSMQLENILPSRAELRGPAIVQVPTSLPVNLPPLTVNVLAKKASTLASALRMAAAKSTAPSMQLENM